VKNDNLPQNVNVDKLQISDRVRLNFMKHSTFNVAVVKQITDIEVILFRPYVHTSDCVYSSGVICYHGHEDIKLFKSDRNLTFDVIERVTVN
jgi:hypothetical protein